MVVFRSSSMVSSRHRVSSVGLEVARRRREVRVHVHDVRDAELQSDVRQSATAQVAVAHDRRIGCDRAVPVRAVVVDGVEIVGVRVPKLWPSSCMNTMRSQFWGLLFSIG